MSSSASVYRIFKRHGGEAASVRLVVITMIVLALGLVSVGVVRVTREHEVLRLGLALSKSSENVRKLREGRRQLELELATHNSPDRIRRLATQLGMTPVAPDKIRVVNLRATVGVTAHPTPAVLARPRKVAAR